MILRKFVSVWMRSTMCQRCRNVSEGLRRRRPFLLTPAHQLCQWCRSRLGGYSRGVVIPLSWLADGAESVSVRKHKVR
jgi:hypothetical protein